MSADAEDREVQFLQKITIVLLLSAIWFKLSKSIINYLKQNCRQNCVIFGKDWISPYLQEHLFMPWGTNKSKFEQHLCG